MPEIRLTGVVPVLVLLCFTLAACADDSSDRQFAGDEQSTAGPTSTAPAFSTGVSDASPVAIASPLAESELFQPRGDQAFVAFITDDHLYLAQAFSSHPELLDLDDRWKPWLVAPSATGSQIATLVSLHESLAVWKLLILDPSGKVTAEFGIVGDDGSPVVSPDLVTTGPGGLDWSPDGNHLAVALPTGGIYRVSVDGAVAEMAPPRRVPRPGDVAWSSNGQAIAYTSQPNARSGFGVYVASSMALPVDPVTVLAPDPTGNRSARDLLWTPDDDHIVVILDRRETGSTGGDVMEIPARGGSPVVVWSSGLQIVDSGAQEISLSPDGQVLAILSSAQDGRALLLLRQFDGPSEARTALGVELSSSDMAWTAEGVLIGGTSNVQFAPRPLAVVIDSDGHVVRIDVAATPEAVGSPAASPLPVEGTPSGSPAAATPVASPDSASPVASPGPATPVASPASD